MVMYKITIVFGILLICTGLAGYFGTDTKSLTALIPSAIGIIILLCGLLAANEKRRMMAMHIAVLIGLIGALGLIPQLIKENQPPAALASKIITLVLCVVFVGVCVRSFILARQSRGAATNNQETEDAPENT
tara:strand:+ start:839 stop:1234 length:396 start_codon:yes stop_codon:yes gene_type:complete